MIDGVKEANTYERCAAFGARGMRQAGRALTNSQWSF